MLPSEQAPPGFELPMRLLLGFRVIIDELHAELATRGHPEVRPMHGFVLQAVGSGTTAVELARRLGVSKQAAGKTITTLEKLGYLTRTPDAADTRRKIVRRTARGEDCLTQSARIFDRIHAHWARTLGEQRLRQLETDLRRLTPANTLPVDIPGWFGGD